MAEVTMSLEEYLELIDQSRNRKRPAPPGRSARAAVKRKKRGKKDPKMAKALRKANAMGRKKSGGFKKGWSQGKIMKKAHQLRRRMR
jgi:hypothetical protein